MSIEVLPLCDGGKCAVILEAVARRDDRLSTAMAGVIAEALEATLAELGVDHAGPTVRATLGRHLARLGTVDSPERAT